MGNIIERNEDQQIEEGLAHILEQEVYGELGNPELDETSKMRSLDEIEDEETGSTYRDKLQKEAGMAFEYFSNNYNKWIDNNNFANLNIQWDEQQAAYRRLAHKPVLTFNICQPMINEVLGEDRNSAPGLILKPIESDNSQVRDKTKLYDDLVREILYHSKFPTQRQEVLRDAVSCGFGGYEIYREYEHARSFNQRLGVKHILEVCGAFWDPNATDPVKSDGDYCGRIFRLSKEKYHSEYGKEASDNSFAFGGGQFFNNQVNDRDDIFLGRMWRKRFEPVELAELSDGTVVLKKEVKEEIAKREAMQSKLIAQGKLDALRPITVHDTRWADDGYKIIEWVVNGDDILEEKEWPSQYLPLIYQDGDGRYHLGNQYIKSYTDVLRDIQKAVNFVRSEQVTAVQYASYGKWMLTREQLEGNEVFWNNPNKSYAYMLYNYNKEHPDDRPFFQQGSAYPVELLQLADSISNTGREVMGKYATMDGRGNEESGRARRMRISQENTQSNIYISNSDRALLQIGMILVDMIPRVYSKTRLVSLRDKENKSYSVRINQPAPEGMHLNELDLDNLSIMVEAGVNYELQLEAERGFLLELAATNPNFAAAAPDLLASTYNGINKEEIVERAKLILPPQIKAQVEGDEQAMQQANQPPPEVMLAQEKIKAQMMEVQQRAEESKINAQVKMQEMQVKLEIAKEQRMVDLAKIEFEKFKLIQVAAKGEQEVETTNTRAQAEVIKADLATKNAHFTHVGKILDESDAHDKIDELLKENEKLRKQISESKGADNDDR